MRIFLSAGAALALGVCQACSSADDASSSASTTSDNSATNGSNDPCAVTAVDGGLGRIGAGGQAVALNATVSENTAGCASVTWTQISGAATSLSSASLEDPIVTLPSVSVRETLVFEITADDGNGVTVNDTVAIEVWVGADSTTDRTVLGDFSARADWACDVDPPAATSVSTQDQGAETAYTVNEMPSHATGAFPNSGNPNAISAQSKLFFIPNTPVKTSTATEMAEFGLTIDGVRLERDTAESFQNAGVWQYEAVTPGLAEGSTVGAEFAWLGTDCNNAHVQPTGAYHYHGLMEGLINAAGETDAPPADMVLGGYAADGFPFYLRYGYNDPNDAASGLTVIEASWELRSGARGSGPGGAYDGTFRQDWEYVAASGDLDECGGRFGVTPEFPGGVYHYYVTDDYPYIPRCVFGTPDSSFRRR
ncbi:MAG: YHYH protein [Pseudomonadota bacterium]